MRRAGLLFLLVSVLLTVLSCAVIPPAAPFVPQRALDASVVIFRTSSPDVTTGEAPAVQVAVRCGGIAIGPHEILTAQHCTTGNYEPGVRFATRELFSKTTSKEFLAEVIESDEAGDIAVLRTAVDLPAFVSRRAVRDVEPAVLILPLRDFDARQVFVAAGETFLPVAVQRGDSGSPLVGADGNVLGVVHSCWVNKSGDCVPERGFEWRPVVR